MDIPISEPLTFKAAFQVPPEIDAALAIAHEGGWVPSDIYLSDGEWERAFAFMERERTNLANQVACGSAFVNPEDLVSLRKPLDKMVARETFRCLDKFTITDLPVWKGDRSVVSCAHEVRK